MTIEKEHSTINTVLLGNTRAYELLVKDSKDKVFGVAYQVVRDNDIAKDISQDALIKAYRSLGKFQRKCRFSTWVCQIAYHYSISYLRKQKRLSALDNYNENDLKINDIQVIGKAIAALQNEEQKAYLEQALSSLEARSAMLVQQYYFEETPIVELEEITGLSNSNIKTLLFRARKKLYIELHRLLKEEAKEII